MQSDRQISEQEIADIAMPLSQFLPRLDVRTWPAMIACSQLEISKKQSTRTQSETRYHSHHRRSDENPFFWTEFMVLVPHICWYENGVANLVFFFEGSCGTPQCHIPRDRHATRASGHQRMATSDWHNVYGLQSASLRKVSIRTAFVVSGCPTITTNATHLKDSRIMLCMLLFLLKDITSWHACQIIGTRSMHALSATEGTSFIEEDIGHGCSEDAINIASCAMTD